MNLAQAFDYAKKFHKSSRDYPTADAFVKAMEDRFDLRARRIVKFTSRREARKRQKLLDVGYGHEWDPATLICIHCRLSFRAYCMKPEFGGPRKVPICPNLPNVIGA